MLIGESCTFRKKSFKVGPSSSVITIPRGLGIEPGDEVEVTLNKQKPVLMPEEPVSIYDPTQEIVERLDRIAAALEESAAMVREEFRAKGYAIPKKD